MTLPELLSGDVVRQHWTKCRLGQHLWLGAFLKPRSASNPAQAASKYSGFERIGVEATGINEFTKHRRSGPAGTGNDAMVANDKKFNIWQSQKPPWTPLACHQQRVIEAPFGTGVRAGADFVPEQHIGRPTGRGSVTVDRRRDSDGHLDDGSLADGIWSPSGARLGEPGQVVDASAQSQTRRPTCVVVTAEAPALNYSGGKVRLTATIEALSVDHDVTVVLRWPEHAGPDLMAAARQFCSERDITLIYWPASGFAERRRWLRRIKGGFGALHPITDRLLQRRVPDSIETLVTNADLLWVVRPGVLTGTAPPAHTAMVLDVDDLIEDVHVAPSIVERAAIRRHLRVRFNLASSARFSLVCSEQDRRVARIPREIRILPNTASSPSDVFAHGLVGQDPSLAGESDTATQVVLLVGSMNYGPNSEGAKWIGELVWPLVTAVRPDAVLRIVGRHSECLESLGVIRGVEIVGAVDDMAPYLDEAMVSVAPIHRGSGTRVKVLEAFAAGVPVVATTIGAYGIDVRVGTDLHVTDDPVEFADAIVALLDDRAARTAMGHAGRAVYERDHSASVFTEHVRAIARDAVANRS